MSGDLNRLLSLVPGSCNTIEKALLLAKNNCRREGDEDDINRAIKYLNTYYPILLTMNFSEMHIGPESPRSSITELEPSPPASPRRSLSPKPSKYLEPSIEDDLAKALRASRISSRESEGVSSRSSLTTSPGGQKSSRSSLTTSPGAPGIKRKSALLTSPVEQTNKRRSRSFIPGENVMEQRESFPL